MEFERHYDAPPERVFAALLSELTDSGQVEGVGDFGNAVTFKIADTRLQPAPTLLAQVRTDGANTILLVRESHDGQWRTLHDDHHLLHLTQLLDRVNERLS